MATATYWQRGDAIDYTNGGSAKIEANTVIAFGTKIGIAGTDIMLPSTSVQETAIIVSRQSSAEAVTAPSVPASIRQATSAARIL